MGDQVISYRLIFAVRRGNLEEVRELISSLDLSYSQEWSEGYVLLRDAVMIRHTEISKLLLTNGSRVNSKKEKPFNTPLHFAVINGDIEIVNMLLCRGANIDAKNQYDRTPFHNAVESKNIEIIELLLNRGAYVNARDSNSITPLHLAVEKGSDEEIIKLLLSRGANVDANGYLKIVENLLKHGAHVNSAYTYTCWKGYTPLHLAVENGSEEIIKLLLSKGANVDAKGENGITSLHIAAERGCLQIVEHLLKHGAHVNSTYTSTSREGYTPLHLAVEKGSEEIIKLVLNRGANVDAKGENDITSLHIAAERGYLEIVEHLLKHGAHVNSAYTSTCREGYTPLHLAVKESSEEIIKLLLSRSANVDAKGENGITALHIAAKGGYLPIVEHLLKHGAHVNSAYTSTRWKDYTPLHFAVEKGSEEIIKLLLNRGANVNAKGKYGITSLHIAAERGYLQIVEHLLKHGARVNSAYTSTGREGYTPLYLAVEEGHEKVVKLLLEYGANVDAKEIDGITSLHIAANGGYLQIVKHLLKHGAHVNSANTSTCWEGYTPLHFAVKEAKKGYLQIVDHLLKHGAHVNSAYPFREGCTPLYLAVEEGHEKVVKLLLEYGANFDDDYHDSGCGEVIAEIFKHHIIKIKTANLYVSGKNLLSIDGNYKIRGFQNKCEKEVASMRSEKIGNSNTSFCNILTKSINQLAILLENENIVQFLRSDNYKIKFPIYASMINSQFMRGERRKELLEQINKNCFSIFPKLPFNCTQKVLSYLSDEDLRILIDACQPTNVSSNDTNVDDVKL
ncbi:unnamed protein product [Lasius platythorax]|uniref:PRANC domain-containing protein n=1 Tax=Lasius platythorax TaxID=488582 RepID=A0AAV2P9X4_9HYME